VLLRRVDSNSLDPLELDASSQLGVPGLIDVLRKNGVVVANMPGSGVMEARALLGFLPSLSRRFFGEGLKMPHIATWWCGQKAAREEVLSRLDEVAIEGAYRRGVPAFRVTGRCSPASCREASANGSRPRSTIAASTMSARSWFAFRLRRCGTRDGSRRARLCCGYSRPQLPMAGPSCPAASAGSPTSSMPVRCRWGWREGGRCVGGLRQDGFDGQPAAADGYRTDQTHRRRGPSRAADICFWLGRYLERAEATLRLVRALGTSQRDPGKGRPPCLIRWNEFKGFW